MPDLLSILTGFFPESYLQPIRDVGPGYEVYQALAAMWDRLQLAISRTDADAFISSAAGAGAATGTVLFSRPTHDAGAVTMQAGSIVRASANGAPFLVVSDAVFGSTDLGPISAPIVALGYGYEYNVPGKFTAPNGDVDPGAIDTIDLPLLAPPLGDQTIVVTNDDPTTGGRPSTLDMHGSERELPRYKNESDPAYRARLQMVTDTVAPAAMLRQIRRYIYPTGLPWSAFENFDQAYQECWDAPSQSIPPAATDSPDYNPNLFTYDDPRPDFPVSNRWLGVQDFVGAFTVQVERPPWIEEWSMAYDDTGATVDADQTSPLGRRSVSAYDVPITLPQPSMPGFFDATDFGIDDFLSGLLEMLDRTKAYGVLATVIVADPGTL